MGVGQPLSTKLKNVHLPHPHPNGGFSLGGGLVLSSEMHLAELVVGISEVTAGVAASDVLVVVLLSSWGGISAKSRAHIQFIHVLAHDKSHMHAS